MPIQFSCPACGKQTLVDDQYAGQSGPCGGCGKTITVPSATAGASGPFTSAPLAQPSFAKPPLPSGGYYGPPAKPSGGGNTLVVILAVAVVGLLFCGGIMVALLLPAVSQARGAARRVSSSNNLKQIAIAMHNYHDVYAELPPAYVTDANGKPLYSGLVLLLPFMESSSTYQQFKLDEAWDSPTNLRLSNLDIPVLQNPANPSKAPGHCDYLLVGGPGSALDPAVKGKRSFARIVDGTSNTLMAVETKIPSRSWAEPRVWDRTQPFDSPHDNVVQVALFDASVHSIPKSIDGETLRRLEQAADGQPVMLP